MPRSYTFDLMRLVENHEIIFEQHTAFDLFIHAAEVHEKQSVI